MGGGPFFLSYYYKKWCGKCYEANNSALLCAKKRYGSFAIKRHANACVGHQFPAA